MPQPLRIVRTILPLLVVSLCILIFIVGRFILQPERLLERANEAAEQGEFDSAVGYLTVYLAMHSNSSIAYFNRGTAFLYLGLVEVLPVGAVALIHRPCDW